MKLLRVISKMLVTSLMLAACSSTAAPAPVEDSNTVGEDTAVEAEAVMPEEGGLPEEGSLEESILFAPDDLIGVWRGQPAAGILLISADFEVTFAQNLEDVLGSRPGPTLYTGSIEVNEETITFSGDGRCDGLGSGTYTLDSPAQDEARFEVIEDACDSRVANLMGQRLEPQIDVTWQALDLSAEIAGEPVESPLGIWRGQPSGGILQITADNEVTFAQNIADLLGTRPVPTLYQGSSEVSDAEIIFSGDIRCQEQDLGSYSMVFTEDGGMRFELVEDACDKRIANLIGQRLEPQVDVTWYLLEISAQDQ